MVDRHDNAQMAVPWGPCHGRVASDDVLFQLGIGDPRRPVAQRPCSGAVRPRAPAAGQAPISCVTRLLGVRDVDQAGATCPRPTEVGLTGESMRPSKCLFVAPPPDGREHADPRPARSNRA